MAKAKKQAPKAAPNPFAELEFGVPGLSGMMSALNPVAAKAVVDAMNENTRFITERVQATVALQQGLLACQTPVAMMELQSSFAKETVEACSAEMTRYATLFSESLTAITKDAKYGHRRAYNDVPV